MKANWFKAKMGILLVVLALWPGLHGVMAAQGSDVVGTTYTSPSYGYTITWQSPWFFLEESTEVSTDFLLLSDGVSFVQFYGGESPGAPAAELTSFIAFAASDPAVSNFGPVLDEAGAPIREEGENYAFARYSASVDPGDGTVYATTNHYEVRTIAPGLSLLIIADVPSESYADYQAAWEQLFTGVSVTRSDTGLPDPGVPPAPGGDEPGPAPIGGVDGEPAPAFVSGQWRLGVTGATMGAEYSDLGLEPKVGMEWLVVFADVTNFSNVDGMFAVKDLLVRTDDAAEATDLAASSTRRVARLTQLSPENGRTVDIAAGETAQVVIVYSVPAGGALPALILGNQVLPIDDIVQVAFDPATLEAPSGPPDLQSGIITSVKVLRSDTDPADGPASTELTVDVDGFPTAITLIGTDIPVSGQCHGETSQSELLALIGSTVLLESDPALTQVSGRYLWIENPDGTRSMLNQTLIEHGAARPDPLPDAARFGSWLETTGNSAEAAGSGLWAECAAA